MTEIIESNDGKLICIRFKIPDELILSDEFFLTMAIRNYTWDWVCKQGLNPKMLFMKDFATLSTFNDIVFLKPPYWDQIKEKLLL